MKVKKTKPPLYRASKESDRLLWVRMNLTESTVEDATLEWFGELGYAVGHGPQLAPGEPVAERDSFGEVVLAGRLREAIRRLNPVINGKEYLSVQTKAPDDEQR